VPVDLELFKRVVGSFPAGVAVVTARGADGVSRGMTSNAICSVSASPPQLLVCVDKRSQTLSAIRGARSFVVNILAAGREALSDRFASKHHDKLAGVTWEPSRVAGGAPVLVDDVVAAAECLVTKEIDAGDHWIVVGTIEAGTVHDRVPLMYYRRVYASWPKPELTLAAVGAAAAGAASADAADWPFHWDFH
jgi:flavin reductase (DIM6/NTAB) family NADH-FMN oxidoreductase RutF